MSETTPVRTALLEAAYDEVVSGSWARTRMADVARGAGVSRQTLYNEFGTKDALAEALAEQHTLALLAGVDQQLASTHDADPIEVLRDTLEWVLDRAHEDPLVKTILVSAHEGGDTLLPLITTRAQPVLEQGSAHLLAFLSRHWPAVPRRTLRDLSDSMIRLIVSHVVLSTEPTQTTARVVSSLAALVLSAPATQGV